MSVAPMQPGLIFVYNISTENVGTTLEESAYRLVQRKIYKVVKAERKETHQSYKTQENL